MVKSEYNLLGMNTINIKDIISICFLKQNKYQADRLNIESSTGGYINIEISDFGDVWFNIDKSTETLIGWDYIIDVKSFMEDLLNPTYEEIEYLKLIYNSDYVDVYLRSIPLIKQGSNYDTK